MQYNIEVNIMKIFCRQTTGNAGKYQEIESESVWYV